MMLISCPHCGPRNQEEFTWGGEAHIERPRQPDSVSDADWVDYLYRRKNTCGVELERWLHIYGCGRWFHVARDTLTHEIRLVYSIDEMPPEQLP